MTLQVGQVGIVIDGSPRFWPRTIRWATHNADPDVPVKQVPYHVRFAVTPSTCIDVQPGGIVEQAEDAYGETIWSRFELKPDAVFNAITFARDQLGAPYAYVDDLIAGIDVLTPITFPRSVYGALINGHSWMCSAFGAMCLMLEGVEPWPKRHPGSVVPADFGKLFRTNGWLPSSST